LTVYFGKGYNVLAMLDKKDLQAIGYLIKNNIEANNENVKDMIDFAVEKSEIRIKNELGAEIKEIKNEVKEIKNEIEEIDRNINYMIKTDQEFLKIFNNHETRIEKLEIKTDLAK